ncbi:hypothetical protein [Pseudomonas phage 98PfluR60PP]|uniref:Uncharacterized protein n=1 Tax=Pseudomonas phage 98PfluR60PP TaxID=2163965 RepID=A0A2S1PFW5_9CAUD|nr:hypothetical protein PP760_gp31 [Pseudomonas phage 98PfluR60PP]AWH15463.1 hypothetical protein [Pseudomonas phage 98PfluR60PP]
MTQQKIDNLPIAEMANMVIIKQPDGKWRIGYVLDGNLFIHNHYLSGTFNSVREKIPQYMNVGCAIVNWETQWYGADEDISKLEIFSHANGWKTSLLEIQQAEAIERIKSQEVRGPQSHILSSNAAKDPSPILSKSDEEIIADIQGGVLINKTKPYLIHMEEVDEPPIMAAGALADAGLLNNQKIGLPSDLLRAAQWPAYWKFIPAGWSAVDTYRIGQLFPVDDPSGRIIHARKKLLVPGVRTGGKSMFKDIKEARDTLTQWLEDNPE